MRNFRRLLRPRSREVTKCLLVETDPVKNMHDNRHIEQFTEYRPTPEFGKKKEKKKNNNSLGSNQMP